VVYVELVLETKDQKGNNHVVFYSFNGEAEDAKKEIYDDTVNKWIAIPSPNGVFESARKDHIAKFKIYPSSVVTINSEERVQ
jgi:hypothetical protein